MKRPLPRNEGDNDRGAARLRPRGAWRCPAASPPAKRPLPRNEGNDRGAARLRPRGAWRCHAASPPRSDHCPAMKGMIGAQRGCARVGRGERKEATSAGRPTTVHLIVAPCASAACAAHPSRLLPLASHPSCRALHTPCASPLLPRAAHPLRLSPHAARCTPLAPLPSCRAPRTPRASPLMPRAAHPLRLSPLAARRAPLAPLPSCRAPRTPCASPPPPVRAQRRCALRRRTPLTSHAPRLIPSRRAPRPAPTRSPTHRRGSPRDRRRRPSAPG